MGATSNWMKSERKLDFTPPLNEGTRTAQQNWANANQWSSACNSVAAAESISPARQRIGRVGPDAGVPIKPVFWLDGVETPSSGRPGVSPASSSLGRSITANQQAS